MPDLPAPWDTAVFAGGSVDTSDPDSALATYERAIREGAADTITLVNYGVLLWRLFRFRQGDEMFRRVLADPGANTAALRRVAHCYFEIGRFDKAADTMRVALARTTESDAATTNTLAWTLERDHRIEEARNYAESAHSIDPFYGPAVRLLAHLDKRAGEMEQAERRLTEQLRRYPSEFDWGLYYELASVRDRLGHYDAAWSALCQAKSHLADEASVHLQDSYFIRRRQWELAKSVTSADLRRWKRAGDLMKPPKRIAFLTGFPRSGTTLLEQIIATHPEVVDTDESGILPRQFIEPIVWKAEDAMNAIIELRAFEDSQLKVGRDVFYELTESYLDQQIGGRLLIEKNPLLTADLPLALRLFPEASVLIALRDPRDVVLSYLFTMVPLNWSSAPAINVVEACQFYADTMRHWLWWRSRLDWPTCEVHYEDVIADPLVETQRVAEFLGLSWDPSMLDVHRRSERRAVRTPTYDDITKPLYTRAIGRWKNYERFLAPGLRILRPFLEAFHFED